MGRRCMRWDTLTINEKIEVVTNFLEHYQIAYTAKDLAELVFKIDDMYLGDNIPF